MKKLFIPLLLISNLCFSQVNLTQGLMAYYPFSGNANDVSGNNNNPVFNNATLTADRFGNANSAYHFNGTNNYMKILNSPSLNMANQMSIALWVKPTGYYTGPCYNNMMVMKGDADYLPGNYFLRFADAYTGCTTPNTANEMFYGSDAIATTPLVQLNQWYSVVCTSDGTTAKIYVNCQLKQSVPATSTTFTNAFDLYIGHLNNASYPYWLNGDLDEVRIYNRALTTDEVNVLSSCPVAGATISNIINTYTPVQALDVCTNKITVEDGSTFNTGDTVLLIQMKGAIIDSSNTATFGTITNYQNSGNYEFNYVKSKSGNIIELKNKFSRQYDIPTGKVQLIRVPYYNNANISATLTCLPWDGSKGGVLVLNALNEVVLNANIDVSGKGFSGAAGYNPGNGTLNCNQNGYNYPLNTLLAAQKGESITIISNNIICGKGNPAAGGGGGLGHNSGGGGGGNAGNGGFGGYQLDNCGNAPFDNRGLGGSSLNYNSGTNKIFMGSGGGAGHADNAGNTPPSGGNGGGIAIIIADQLFSNGNKIISDGNNAVACSIPPSPDCHDGMGGGGAGGTVLLSVNKLIDNTIIENKGGKGTDMVGSVALGGRVGPGGGGGGGFAFLKNASIPVLLNITNTGGPNGVLTTDANNPWGATPGSNGLNLFNLVLPFDTMAFKINIDSVRIKDSAIVCNGFNFNGLAYTNTNPVNTWQWDFGDGGTANVQNTSHTYATSGTFTVKLFVTDTNGCIDSISNNIVATPAVTANAGTDTAVCTNGSVSLMLHGTAIGGPYSWSPANFLNNSTIQNPIATINNTTRFYLTITNALGCSANDSVTIYVNPLMAVTVQKSNDIDCSNGSAQLLAFGGSQYIWSPATGLNNTTIANPVSTVNNSQQYIVKVTNTVGCISIDSITVFVSNLNNRAKHMPNAFTPNGDGINDCFGLKYWGHINQLQFYIFNRWGERVFATSNPTDCWDGNYNGNKADPGTYVFYIKAQTNCGTVEQKGTFLLIR